MTARMSRWRISPVGYFAAGLASGLAIWLWPIVLSESIVRAGLIPGLLAIPAFEWARAVVLDAARDPAPDTPSAEPGP